MPRGDNRLLEGGIHSGHLAAWSPAHYRRNGRVPRPLSGSRPDLRERKFRPHRAGCQTGAANATGSAGPQWTHGRVRPSRRVFEGHELRPESGSCSDGSHQFPVRALSTADLDEAAATLRRKNCSRHLGLENSCDQRGSGSDAVSSHERRHGDRHVPRVIVIRWEL